MAKKINEETFEKCSKKRAENDIQYMGISIETRKYAPYKMIGGVEEYVDCRGIASHIRFSKPIEDTKRLEHLELYLETEWYGLNDYYWKIQLEDKDNTCISELDFNRLNEHFSSYTKERVIKWLEDAWAMHSSCLIQIERLYWKNQRISNDFFQDWRRQ